MRKELRRYSSIGNKAGILLLCKKVLTGRMEVLSSIGASCSFINGVELNFKCGIIAFEDIGLISVSDGKCIAKDILYSAQSESAFLEHLCRYCMNALIQMDLIQIDYLKYNELKDAFQIPMYAFNLECAVYRNMLITFGALVPEGALFTINDKFEEDFTKYVSKKRTISQEQLLTKIEKERIIGEKGEAFVLSFEKKRCPFTYKQLKRIKQISIVDASAGYDILSFENEFSDAKRYIEVKTYCGNVHFHWSSNEIEAARLRNASYYLYLVDYTKISIEGYTPLMIPNPYVNIKKLSVWDMQPSSYVITTEKEESELKSIFSSDRQNDVADETYESIHPKIVAFYNDEDKEDDRYSMAAESVIPANELTEEQRIDVLRKSLIQMFNHGGYRESDRTFCKQRHWISIYRIAADEGFIIEGDFRYFKDVVRGTNLTNCKVTLNIESLERSIKGIYASSFEDWNETGMTENALKEYNDIKHCAEVFLQILSNNRPKVTERRII